MAVDIFDHHDRVIDQDADREDQGKERNPVEGEAPGPGGKQRGSQCQDHRRPNDSGLTPAQREADQQDDRPGGKSQFLDQLARFFGGGLAVVARDGGMDVGWQYRVAQHPQPFAHRARHVNRVLARFFGDGDGQRRMDAAGRGHWRAVGIGLCGCASGREPDVALRQSRTGLDARNLAQINREALVNADDQVADILLRAQELAGFDADHLRRLTRLVDDRTRGHAEVRSR